MKPFAATRSTLPSVYASAPGLAMLAATILLSPVHRAHAIDNVPAAALIPVARPLKPPPSMVASDSNTLKHFRKQEVASVEPFFEEAETVRCRETPQRFCRDFAKTEFQVTSLHFMVPPVPGLAPRSLTFRRNTVIANYTFR